MGPQVVRTPDFAAIYASVRYGKYHGDPAGAFDPATWNLVRLHQRSLIVDFWLKQRSRGMFFGAVVPNTP